MPYAGDGPSSETAFVPELTSDEKTMAALARVLQIVGWWIAPYGHCIC